MSPGLFRKSLRETMGFTLAFGVGLFGFHCLLAYVAPIILTELSDRFLRMMIVKSVIKGLLGNDAGQSLGGTVIAAFAWIHPIPLILVWTQSIVFWSRVPATEIENGTIDILLSQPISRFRLFLHETIIWLLCGIFLIGACVCGNSLGSRFISSEHRLSFDTLLKIAVNLYGLYVVTGGVSCLFSAMSSRRGVAMGLPFIFVAISYLINTLVPFWSAIQTISFLSFMDYYKPLVIVRTPSWPFWDLSILAGLSFVFWLAGLTVFSRRNLLTA